MEAFFKYLAEILAAAAQSGLGMIALLAIILSLLAYFFFKDSSDNHKTIIFITLFCGVVALCFAIFKVLFTTKSPYKDETFTVSGTLKQNHSQSYEVKLEAGFVLEVIPTELDDDSLYYDLAVYSKTDSSKKCEIGEWRGSSGTLGNGLLYKIETPDTYIIKISTRLNYDGPYKLFVTRNTPDPGRSLTTGCREIL